MPLDLAHIDIYCDESTRISPVLQASGTIPILRHLILVFLKTHPLCQHKQSTEHQYKLPFSEPTQPVFSPTYYRNGPLSVGSVASRAHLVCKCESWTHMYKNMNTLATGSVLFYYAVFSIANLLQRYGPWGL